jgi:hypothetical protein
LRADLNPFPENWVVRSGGVSVQSVEEMDTMTAAQLLTAFHALSVHYRFVSIQLTLS